MAGPAYGVSKGWAVGEAITKYHFVKLVGAEVLNMCDTQGEVAIGVAQQEVSDAAAIAGGAVCNVAVSGITRVIAGGTFAIMANVTVGLTGRAEVAAVADNVVGIALQAAVAGDHVDVLLTQGGIL